MTINVQKILLVDEFLQSCKAIRREKWRYFFLFSQFTLFCGLWEHSFDDNLLLINCILCAFFAIRHGVSWRKIGAVMLIYAIMTAFPIVLYGINASMSRQYIGYAIRILTGCFIASYFRYDFVSKFENLVFVLAYISIPLFALQVINPHIYDVFTPFSKAIMTNYVIDVPNGQEGLTMHQYIIIYVLNCFAPKRNSGFMWEPGAFAMMLTWAMLFLLYLIRFRWHRRIIVYAIAMLTTFSLLGYACLAVLAVLYFAQNAEWRKIGYAVVGISLMLLLFSQLSLFREQREMMTDKVEFYTNDSEAQLKKARQVYVKENKSNKNVGRLAQFYILKDIILNEPFGHGMSTWRYSSANGLISLIVKWGINSIIALTLSIFYFIKLLSRMGHLKPTWFIILLSMLIFIMPMISNPIYNRVLFMALITFPFFAKRQML